MEETQMKTITTLNTVGREFTIVFDNEQFMAVENKYIDATGKLTKALTNFELGASEDLDVCIEKTIKRCEHEKKVAELVAAGEDAGVATLMASGFSRESALELAAQLKALDK